MPTFTSPFFIMGLTWGKGDQQDVHVSWCQWQHCFNRIHCFNPILQFWTCQDTCPKKSPFNSFHRENYNTDYPYFDISFWQFCLYAHIYCTDRRTHAYVLDRCIYCSDRRTDAYVHDRCIYCTDRRPHAYVLDKYMYCTDRKTDAYVLDKYMYCTDRWTHAYVLDRYIELMYLLICTWKWSQNHHPNHAWGMSYWLKKQIYIDKNTTLNVTPLA